MVAVLVTTSGHWQLHSMKFLTTTNTVVRVPTPSHMFPSLDSFHHLWAPTTICETASSTIKQNKYYLEDPLWDGQGCGRFSSCCDGGRKPWFCKELPMNVTDDSELRVCCNQPEVMKMFFWRLSNYTYSEN